MNTKRNLKLKILDGPMGTELDRRGLDTTLPLWSARTLIEDPEQVKKVHIEYINAGADIITTNTFRTQDRTITNANLKLKGITGKKLTKVAIDMAQEARNLTRNCLIAGSIAPIEDCYSPELVPTNRILIKEHTNMVSYLAEGVDLFLIETMNSFREAKVALQATGEYPDIPTFISFTCDTNGNILDGTSWKTVVPYIKEQNHVDVLLVNCSSLKATLKAVEALHSLRVEKFGAYPNFGEVDKKNGWSSGIIDEKFDNFLAEIVKYDPVIIGTCCGATPKETHRLVELLRL